MSCKYYYFKSNDYYCTKQEDYVDTDTYYRYCRNYDYDDCPIYCESSGGCFLTTACMKHFQESFDDNCYELTVLRQYRDLHVSKEDIEHYYAIAPKIVFAINNRPDNDTIYQDIYENCVAFCVKAIEEGKLDDAYTRYKDTVLRLEKAYLV